MCAADVARRAEEDEAEDVTGPRRDGGVGDRPAWSVAELSRTGDNAGGGTCLTSKRCQKVTSNPTPYVD